MESEHETKDFMVVYGSQTSDYKALPFILSGNEMCSYNLYPRDVLLPALHLSLIPLLGGVGGRGGGEITCILEMSFHLLPISTVHSLIPLPMLVH